MFVGDSHSADELWKLARRRIPRIKRRFKAVSLAKTGLSAREVAWRLGCSARAVQMWVDYYNRGGVEALSQWWEPERFRDNAHAGAAATEAGEDDNGEVVAVAQESAAG